MEHCLKKLHELCHGLHPHDGTQPGQAIRDTFQLGYNAGRIAELTGWGRKVWDELKVHVGEARGDRALRLCIIPWAAELGIDLGPKGTVEDDGAKTGEPD